MKTKSLFAALLCGVAVLLLAGCQSATVKDPLTQTVGGNDPDQQLEFWHQLAERPITSNDEAFHGLLLFAGGQDPADDYAGRVAALKERGMLPGGFNAPADQAVERGTVAVILAKAMNVRGGLVMSLFGASPRYALRELQYLDLYPPSSPNQTFSGAEFLGIIGKAEEFQNSATRGSKSVDVAAVEQHATGQSVPPAATQGAPYPPIPPEPASPQ